MHVETVQLRDDGTAWLDCYLLDLQITSKIRKIRPALIILPGGAYLSVSHREGEPVAARFLGLGYHVFVLHYPAYVVAEPSALGEQPTLNHAAHYPEQLIDAMKAMAYVREHAAEWGVMKDQVYVLGFSAGASVAGTLAERFDQPELLAVAQTTAEVARPDALVLCYPMVTAERLCGEGTDVDPQWAPMCAMVRQAVFGKDNPTPEDYAAVDLRKQVRSNMPRTFVWQTSEDELCSSFETTELVCALQREGVPVEYHLFERGRHGMALADRSSAARVHEVNAEAAAWVELVDRWLALEWDKGVEALSQSSVSSVF